MPPAGGTTAAARQAKEFHSKIDKLQLAAAAWKQHHSVCPAAIIQTLHVSPEKSSFGLEKTIRQITAFN